MFRKFVVGSDANKTYSAADNETLAKLINLTKAIYYWTEKESFYGFSSQKCEDMIIIYVRKSIMYLNMCKRTVRIPYVFHYVSICLPQ